MLFLVIKNTPKEYSILFLVIKNTPKEYSGILNTIFSNQEYYRHYS